MTVWEEIEVPRGADISWGQDVGQHVTGRVLEYGLDTGQDFNGITCPSLTVELIEQADSISGKGRALHGQGEVVQLDVAKESLKAGSSRGRPITRRPGEDHA